MIDLNKVEKLVDILENSGISELTVEEDNFKVTVKKELGGGQVVYSQPHIVPHTSTSLGERSRTGEVSGAPAASGGTSHSVPAGLVAIKSPMVGTYYSKPNPDSDEFVKVGQKVKKGQTVCIVEAMKLFNEIEADTDGTVEKILVNSQDQVEFDQPLILIKP
jgi:acetyl-CoA carboxylase biotin carboxyl carrier protein